MSTNVDFKKLFANSPESRLLIKLEGACQLLAASQRAHEEFGVSETNKNATISDYLDESLIETIEDTFSKKSEVHNFFDEEGRNYKAFCLDQDEKIFELRVYPKSRLNSEEIFSRAGMLRSIFDLTDVGIVIIDTQGNIVKANPGFARMFGWKQEEILNTPFFNIVIPEDRDRVIHIHKKFAEQKGRSTGEVSLFHSNNTIANTLCTTEPLEFEGGPDFLITTIVDITFRKRIEQSLKMAKDQAESSSRAKSSFLANMSHEFRTPLNAIIGFSEMLINQTFGKLGHQKYDEYIQDIHGSACHLLEIINEVLDMSKIESGNVKLNSAPAVLPEIIDSVARMIATESSDKRINLKTEIPEDIPAINVDKRLIRQALINVVSNAFKHCGPETIVKIQAGLSEQNELIVNVIDNGPGIPENKLEHILKPFGQVDDAFRVEGKEDTGLGLPIAKGMIEMHGGRFRISSKVGKGTVIEILIPTRRVMINTSGKAKPLFPQIQENVQVKSETLA